ncbi:MAG: hypothetical protein MZV63_56095 [Marinilabiliales bacterium]|nr:hypothetical protein [Marinilabiliales bacterium]
MPNYTVGVATDNCGVTVTQSPLAGTEFTGDQVVIVTLTANDGNGNVVDCDFNNHFDDQTAPVLTCPGKPTVVLDADCMADMPDYTIGVATDNCNGDPEPAGRYRVHGRPGRNCHTHRQRWQREHC